MGTTMGTTTRGTAATTATSVTTMLAGSKLRGKLSARLVESAGAGIGNESFARRQLVKMGWSEGTGLGKRRTGVMSHVRVERRVEQRGLGHGDDSTGRVDHEGDAATKSVQSAEWWRSSVADTLARLHEEGGT